MTPLRISSLNDEPTLVEQPARDRQRAALEVRDVMNRRIPSDHDRADRRGIRVEFYFCSKRAPEPINDRQVDRTRIERELARIRRGEFLAGQIQVRGAGKMMATDNVQLSGKRTGFLQTDSPLIGRERLRSANDKKSRDENPEHSVIPGENPPSTRNGPAIAAIVLKVRSLEKNIRFVCRQGSSCRLRAIKPRGLLFRIRQIDLANLDDGLVAAEELQLAQNLRNMSLDGRFCEFEFDGDVLVLKSAPDQIQHAKLLGG